MRFGGKQIKPRWLLSGRLFLFASAVSNWHFSLGEARKFKPHFPKSKRSKQAVVKKKWFEKIEKKIMKKNHKNWWKNRQNDGKVTVKCVKWRQRKARCYVIPGPRDFPPRLVRIRLLYSMLFNFLAKEFILICQAFYWTFLRIWRIIYFPENWGFILYILGF